MCVDEHRGDGVLGVRSAGSWAPGRGVGAPPLRHGPPLSGAPCPALPGLRGLASAQTGGLWGAVPVPAVHATLTAPLRVGEGAQSPGGTPTPALTEAGLGGAQGSVAAVETTGRRPGPRAECARLSAPGRRHGREAPWTPVASLGDIPGVQRPPPASAKRVEEAVSEKVIQCQGCPREAAFP